MYRPIAMLVAVAVTAIPLGSARCEEIDPATRAAAERVAIATCATCHGPQGHSIQPKFPVLAGQRATYLGAQLHAFKEKTRGDPDALGYMWGMAAPLSDESIMALADYYSRQAPRKGPSAPAAIEQKGREIYTQGDPAKGIPACAACHGANGEGTDAFPRLAGQHPQYVIKQLRSFESNLRNVAVMHGIAQHLNIEEMTAVAAYVQSLGP
jgi:cytochrome c553